MRSFERIAGIITAAAAMLFVITFFMALWNVISFGTFAKFAITFIVSWFAGLIITGMFTDRKQ